MKLTLLASFCLSFLSALAHSVGDESPVVDERQSGVVLTSGAGGSNVYPRLEIRQMKANNPNQFTLLILAMEQWKQQAQSSQTSYYGISSIHGEPRQPWQNVGPCSNCGDNVGYCPHDSVLFPAWHRTYVALFEQQLITIVKSIANSYPSSTKSAMVDAANTFRFPYWDWAAIPPSNGPALPTLFTDLQVTVNAPSGSRTLNNPLYRYDYSDSSGMYYYPFTDWKKTYRYPTSNNANANSQMNQAANAFANVRQSLQDQVYQLFTSCKDYSHFSNTDASSSSSSCSNSLEGIHNTIHVTAGGLGDRSTSGGHMSYLPLASFDPIFWFHHCNADRLFAMWQRLNPNAYGASQVSSGGTYTFAEGSTQNANSPLKPFFQTSSTFWTTNTVRDWTQFKYTYPEFSNSDGSAAAITAFVNRLYGPKATFTAGSSKKRGIVDGVVGGVVDGLAGALTSDPLRATNGSTFQYVANIQTPRYLLNGSYHVFLFDGQPETEDPASWIYCQNLIGSMGVLSEEGMSRHNIMAAGSIPLTRTLQNIVGNGLLSGLTQALVAPYLASNLRCRIQGPAGDSISPDSIPGFLVEVFSSTASQTSSDRQLPVLSPFVKLLDVTLGLSASNYGS